MSTWLFNMIREAEKASNLKKETSKTIYTLGTSNRSTDEFFSLLKAFGIRGIADVRRFPRSTRFPHFSRENLEKEARRREIVYCWLGDLLGGFRSGGYEAYKEEEAYGRGIEAVEALARELATVLICAERLPWKCHRLQISRSLEERGWEMVHIIDEGRTWQPKGG